MSVFRLMVTAATVLVVSTAVGPGGAAQPATPTAISCDVAAPAAVEIVQSSPEAPASPAAELTTVKVGFVPVSIFAPIFIAKEKGYYAEEGLDVQLEPFPGGSDPVVLTASGELDVAISGAGPAFWNAMAQKLPIKVIAPGHSEGNPVATPLMISKAKCESGEITSVADLKWKKVSVNARGATEYWLNQALTTGGLTIDDVELEVLPFPDAVAALDSGAVDAAMVGEPLATKAEQDGIAIRLATDFPVQDVQPTQVWANETWLKENPEFAEGFVTGYMRAVQEMADGGFNDATNLAIIEQYTGVPADLISASVKPVYAADGQINLEGLSKLQAFFRQRGQLDYETDIDPASIVDTSYMMAALAELNPNSP
jgi:NitT/TauT family transport system substrate-binding protein